MCPVFSTYQFSGPWSFTVDQFMQTFDSQLINKPVIAWMVVVRCLILWSKFAKNRLWAGLCPDPLGELTALSQTPSWIMGEGMAKGRWKGEGE